MVRDQEANRRDQIAGSVKELIGKLIGNKEIEDEGARQKSVGSGIRDLDGFCVPDPDKPV